MSDVFVYMGNGQNVPKDVISVRFHPSVVEVGEEAFFGCSSLREVVLNEGLKKIGKLFIYELQKFDRSCIERWSNGDR